MHYRGLFVNREIWPIGEDDVGENAHIWRAYTPIADTLDHCI